MKLGDVDPGQVENPVALAGGELEENPVALAGGELEEEDDAGRSSRQLYVRGLNRQYESEDELEQAFHKAYAEVEVERVVIFVDHDSQTMKNLSWAVVTMKTEQDAKAVLEKPHSLPGKITVTRASTATLKDMRAATAVVLTTGARGLRDSAVGEYKLSKLHGQAGWSQARKDVPLHLWDRPEHGDSFTLQEQLLKWPGAMLRVILLPAFLGQLPFTIALAGDEKRRCVIPGHQELGSEGAAETALSFEDLTIPCASIHKGAFLYFTCPLWVLGAIFFMLLLYNLQLTDVGFGEWQHYAFIIGCCEMTFLIGEELIWEQFQPETIVAVTLAHMTAIVVTTWPLFALAFYLMANYSAESQDVQVAHGQEWS